MKKKPVIQDTIEFIRNGIWQKKEYEYRSRKARWAIRQAKLLLLMARGFGQHDLTVRSASLTFYTLMSIVPIAALIFGIMKGFGLEANLEAYLHDTLPQYREVIDYILRFANNMLARTKGGLVASFGFVVLLWAVIRVFSNIENAFNHIWEVRRSRSLARKFSDYISVVFVTPILWVIGNGFVITFRHRLASLTWVPWDLLYGLIVLLTVWLMFTFVYYVMPNTKVRFRAALMAGLIAGTSFEIFQIVYFFVQSRLTSYNAVYGTFAAVPLFLIWLQTSWQIVLVGAELSFAYQNVRRYEQERIAGQVSYADRRAITLAAMLDIVRAFLENRGGTTSEEIADRLNIPLRLARDTIFDLERTGLIVAVRQSRDDKVNAYLPARDVHRITLFDVVHSVEAYGNSPVARTDNPELRRMGELLQRAESILYESPDNIPLTDLLRES